VISRGAGTPAPTPELVGAASLHPVLADAMAQAHVDAVAVRCFDYLEELQTSGCVALAELNDSGVVAGCEGDVASTVAMVLLRALFDHAGDADDICRTQVTVRLDGVRAGSLLEAPLGNHLVLFRGRHRDRIEGWWRLALG
jgi:L-fucose isomerase-like protein